MAVELITGHGGTPHVSSADAGHLLACLFGEGAYIVGAAPNVSMSDANTLLIGWGQTDLVLNGRHVHCSGNDTQPILSGGQTGYRHDIVFLRYTYDSDTGVEDVSLLTATGEASSTEAAAADPRTDYSGLSILDGASTVDFPIVRVSLAGLTPSAEWLLGEPSGLMGLRAFDANAMLPVSNGGTGGLLPVANGGTGASTAEAARDNLGLTRHVLYYNDNNRSNTTIPLTYGGSSVDVSDYDWLTICYTTNVEQWASIDVFNPYNKFVSLFSIADWYKDKNLWMKFSIYHIQSSSITVTNNGWQISMTAGGVTGGERGSSPFTYITQVIGHKL